MTDALFFIGAGVFLLLVIVAALLFARSRRRLDYRKYLEPPLAEHGLQFVSADYPGALKIGPFPSIELKDIPAPRRRRYMDFEAPGDYVDYRIVTFRDSSGKAYQVWAMLEFEQDVFRRVRWRAENEDSLPEAVKEMLEN